MAKAEQFPPPLSEQGKTAQDRLVDISVDINTRLEHIAGLLEQQNRLLAQQIDALNEVSKILRR